MMLSTLARDCCVWLETYKNYSPRTAASYGRTYTQFVEFLKQERRVTDDIRQFTDEHVAAFAEALGRIRISPNSIVRSLAALSTLARFGMQRKDAHGRRLVPENPTKSFEWPRRRLTETKYLRPDELRAFLAYELREPYKRLARAVLFDTGLRAQELSRANVGDVHESGGLYYVSVAVKGRGVERKYDVPLSPGCADLVRDALLSEGRLNPDAPLLVNSAGQRWHPTALTNMVARLGRDAGITRFRIGCHTVRHTVNVLARIGGADVVARSKVLGHANPHSLERYEHVLPDELHTVRRQQLEGLDRYLGRYAHGQGSGPATENPGAEKERDDG